jgi:hypothetical protein
MRYKVISLIVEFKALSQIPYTDTKWPLKMSSVWWEHFLQVNGPIHTIDFKRIGFGNSERVYLVLVNEQNSQRVLYEPFYNTRLHRKEHMKYAHHFNSVTNWDNFPLIQIFEQRMFGKILISIGKYINGFHRLEHVRPSNATLPQKIFGDYVDGVTNLSLRNGQLIPGKRLHFIGHFNWRHLLFQKLEKKTLIAIDQVQSHLPNNLIFSPTSATGEIGIINPPDKSSIKFTGWEIFTQQEVNQLKGDVTLNEWIRYRIAPTLDNIVLGK